MLRVRMGDLLYNYQNVIPGPSGERNKEPQHRHACHWPRGRRQGADCRVEFPYSTVNTNDSVTQILGWTSLWNRSEARPSGPGMVA